MKAYKALAQAIALVGVLGASAAGAATYSWTGGTGNLANGVTGGNSDPLRHATAMSFTYNENTQDLTVFSKWYNTSADGAPEGAWLVLSDGSMPKTAGGEVPIYYIDWRTGVNRISASSYDGSVTDGGGQFFGSWDNKITLAGCAVKTTSCTADYQSISFTLNLASINSYDPNGAAAGQGDWKGGDFANNVGVWFHWFDQSSTSNIQYTNVNGQYKVSSVGKTNESWYDTGGCGNKTTITGTPTGGQAGNDVGGVDCNAYGGGGGGGNVPLPGVAMLLGLGLLGLGAKRRK